MPGELISSKSITLEGRNNENRTRLGHAHISNGDLCNAKADGRVMITVEPGKTF